MSFGTPDFGDRATPVFNPLVYPRRVIIEVLESAFSQDSLVTYPGQTDNPFQLKFDANGEPADDTGIVIADTFADELLTKDPRPIVVVDRGSFQFSDSSIDGKGFGGASPSITYTDTDGASSTLRGQSGRSAQTFQDFTNMSISINCYARRSIEAETVAWLSAGFIRMFEQEIREGAQLQKIESPVIGESRVAKADSQNDLFVCPITIVVYQTLKWVKKTTATYQEVLTGIQNLSNSPWPIATNNEPCSNVLPEELSVADQVLWKNES